MDSAYTSFAAVYDSFMSDVPYEEWAEFICRLLREHGIADGLVLELCCGTGTFTELLARAGYDMIGVDNSQEMLDEAVKKRAAAERTASENNCELSPNDCGAAADSRTAASADILYLQQDMREFELYGTVRAIVCVCDSMNYMTSGEDLKKVFSLANNYLDPGGLFVFDMKTVYHLREIMGDSVVTEHRPEGSLIWENNYFEDERTNEYDLTFFLRRQDGLYERYAETHRMRAYEREEVERLLREAGLEVEAVLDADTFGAPEEESERLYFVARESGKMPT